VVPGRDALCDHANACAMIAQHFDPNDDPTTE
jgi:hypothetical protein